MKSSEKLYLSRLKIKLAKSWSDISNLYNTIHWQQHVWGIYSFEVFEYEYNRFYKKTHKSSAQKCQHIEIAKDFKNK